MASQVAVNGREVWSLVEYVRLNIKPPYKGYFLTETPICFNPEFVDKPVDIFR